MFVDANGARGGASLFCDSSSSFICPTDDAIRSTILSLNVTLLAKANYIG